MKKLILVCMTLILVAPSSIAGDLPTWLEGWQVKGDLRLRLETKDSDDSEKEQRDRARFRLRLSASKKITDQLKVSLRFASGTGDPTSTNQSFDNSFSGKDWLIDRAHLSYNTGNWNLHGGKMSNILNHTDIVWDSDVNPEGFFQNYQKGSFYFTMGELFVEESSSGADLNLYVAQFGAKGGDSVKWDVSGAYYSYNSADTFLDTSSDSYDFLDFVAKVDLGKVKLAFNYVNNTTDFNDEVAEDNNSAFSVSASGGSSKPGQWKWGVKYAEVEAYSSFTQFADSDFGFGDKEGFKGDVGYQSSKHIGWNLAVYSVDSILQEDKGYTVAQFDCILKF